MLRFIGFFLIHSMLVNTTCAPSSAGNGNRLNTPKFAAINGINSKILAKLCPKVFATVVTVVIGPPIALIGNWKVISSHKDFKTIHTSPIVNGTHWASASINESLSLESCKLSPSPV